VDDVSDLIVWESVEPAQDEYGPLLWGESTQCALEEHMAVSVFVRGFIGSHKVECQGFLPPRILPAEIRARVAGQPVQPRAERGTPAKTPRITPHALKHLLGDVIGDVTILSQASGQGIDITVMAREQRAQRIRVAALYGGHELRI
jgi:hypothetical protein